MIYSWFTNYESRKGAEIDSNPHAALTFWWGELERQVRIEGSVQKVSVEESTQYFHSRPRNSQIGAWSSHQSKPISSRDALDLQELTAQQQFAHINDSNNPVPKPDHWGGYRLIPTRIEFWKGRASRMHDRIVYELLDSSLLSLQKNISPSSITWVRTRLQP